MPTNVVPLNRIDALHRELSDTLNAVQTDALRLHAAVEALLESGDPGDAPASVIALRDTLRGALALFDAATP
jgi:hypothetical protein